MDNGTTSSGDPIADRRLEMARQLAARGDLAEAVDLAGQALDIVPDWPAGWFYYGDLLTQCRRTADARQAFERCLALDQGDRLGASLRLNLLDGETPDTMPDAYVRALFDDYAPRFDRALVERLGYRAPALVKAAIDVVRPGPLGDMLDLGCGTGLSGAVFRGRADRIDGVDLSSGMIEAARAKNIYDTLSVESIDAFLNSCARSYDVILAVDVLIYLGRLDSIFEAVRRVIKPGGLFCFTVQAGHGDGFMLGSDHRYAYGESYLRRTGDHAGWDWISSEAATLRQDGGRDVAGFVCVFTPR